MEYEKGNLMYTFNISTTPFDMEKRWRDDEELNKIIEHLESGVFDVTLDIMDFPFVAILTNPLDNTNVVACPFTFHHAMSAFNCMMSEYDAIHLQNTYSELDLSNIISTNQLKDYNVEKFNITIPESWQEFLIVIGNFVYFMQLVNDNVVQKIMLDKEMCCTLKLDMDYIENQFIELFSLYVNYAKRHNISNEGIIASLLAFESVPNNVFYFLYKAIKRQDNNQSLYDEINDIFVEKGDEDGNSNGSNTVI